MSSAVITPHCRAATERDVPALLALDAVCAPVDAIDGQELYILSDPAVMIFFLACGGLIVAEVDGQVVGYILSHIVEHMHGIDRLVWIEHIGVHPAFRRRGIGLHLLTYLRVHYRGRAAVLHAAIHPRNHASLELFQRFPAECAERVLAYIAIEVPDAS
ncbi:MAG TPA: GNAT family N-acetyltransferase [Roseiflexaceae bacterium]|nr:GNAT family N-acetyltransferase [Roseiflexaceae bacterium]